MSRQFPSNCRSLTLFIALSLVVTGLVPPVIRAQRKPVVISFGQPNIWSLEQAHYLLARMHMTNLTLQAKALTEDQLDPNRTHGTRIQVLKQLLEIGAQFDQGIGFQNKRIVENAHFNDERRRQLVVRRSTLQNESLALAREISRLETERARMDTDESATDKQKELKTTEIAKKKEELAAVRELLTQDTAELDSISKAENSPTPTSPTALASPSQLPSSMLEGLVQKNADELLKAAQDPKLNATTVLDNTIQLQYEIIAKQLTLLRDEVGPGERLVFLELPQSIYTTPGDGDEKMAQTWWHVNGYTRTDPLLRLLLELLSVEQKWNDIKQVKAYVDRRTTIDNFNCTAPLSSDDRTMLNADPLLGIFVGLKCERRSARKAALDKLYREANSLFSRVEQNGARDTSDQIEVIRKLLAVTNSERAADKGAIRVQEVEARKSGEERLVPSKSQGVEVERRKRIERLKKTLLKVLSQDNPLDTPSQDLLSDKEFKTAWTDFLAFLQEIDDSSKSNGIEKAIEFIRLDDDLATDAVATGTANIQRRTVRTVDIIPRQSSLNVNDINDTVKANRIVAGFKFLFGFAGEVNFHRQREQFEQFLHQELYASGFGKGSRDFGWTFGAVPGTKRVAPGIRTTYAAIIVPEDAESIVLSARGCYFPRKSYQPLDFQDTGHTYWDRGERYKRYNCSDEQKYILTIPGGGDISNFWVTSIDYEHGRKNGDFVTVSVRGNNFSSQMGVLVDGVSLFPTVGLAQQHLVPRKAGANGETQQLPSDCAGEDEICGRYERVDSQQIVFSFKMPAAFSGTPTITLIAPGKSIDLNTLPNVRVNGQANVSLREDAAIMFGMTGLSITGFEILDNVSGTTWAGLLSGTGFNAARDAIFVNGTRANSVLFRSPNLYRITFTLPPDPTFNVTVVRDKQVVSRPHANPLVPVRVTNTTVISYDPPVKKKNQNEPGKMIVKVEGAGFTSRTRVVPELDPFSASPRMRCSSNWSIPSFRSCSRCETWVPGP